MRVQQTGGVQTFPVESHAVAVHHLSLQTFDGNRGPDGWAVHVHRHRHVFDNGAHSAEPVCCLAHFVIDIGFAVGAVKTFKQHTDTQTGDTAS